MSSDKSIEQASAEMIAQGHSLTFLRRHPEYNSCAANNEMLLKEINKQGLPWDLDSLETVFYELTQKGALAPPVRQQPAAPVAAEPAPVVDPFESVPLPTSYGGLDIPDLRTRQDINRLPGKEYSHWYHHPKIGAAFRARVQFILDGGGR